MSSGTSEPAGSQPAEYLFQLYRPILDTVLTLLQSRIWYTVHMTQHQSTNVLYDLEQIAERLRTTYNDLASPPCQHAHSLDRLNVEIALGQVIALQQSIVARVDAQLAARR